MLRAGFHCVNFKVSRGNNPTALVAESHHPSAIVNASELIKSLDGLWRAHHERPIGTSTACAKGVVPGAGPSRGRQSPSRVRASDNTRDPERAICAHPRLGEVRDDGCPVAGIYGVAIDVIERILRRG